MKTVVQKWGNSLALRIPKNLADLIKVNEGASVELTANKNTLFVTPSKVKPTLKELLVGVRQENLHTETPTGHPLGKEVW